MEKGKHQVGYSGMDSMREKAERLFGNAVKGVDMTDVLSASAPSKTPMRKYAKGGHVKHEERTMREGSMMPKSAKGEVFGGTLTDMHMPKKVNTKAFKNGGKVDCYKAGGVPLSHAREKLRDHLPSKAYKTGGLVRFEGEHEDRQDDMHARQATKSKLSSMMKGTKANAEHPKNADKEQAKIGMRGTRETKNTDSKETTETLRSKKMSEPKARTMSFKPGADKQVGMAIPKRKMKEGFKTGGSVKKAMGGMIHEETDRGPIACGYGRKSMPLDHAHGEYEEMKKGGKVRAKTTSTMRQAVKGRSMNVDMSTKKGQVLDVGSVKQNSTPKQKSMLHPKAASNGDKHSKLNIESVPRMNGMVPRKK